MSNAFWQKMPAGFHQRRCCIAGNFGFEVFIWRGEDADSKVLLLNGATHGDEWEGPTFLTELAQSWRPDVLSGTIVAVPVLNESAFFACERCAPLDKQNLARVFPGKDNGTYTEELAYTFENHFIAEANYYVDFHSAGAPHEIFPWVGYAMSGDESTLKAQRLMSRCFPNVWHWGTPYLPGRTISAAHEHNVAAVYLECQGKGGVEPSDLEILRVGFDNLTKAFGLIEGEPQLHEPMGVRESTLGEEGHLQVENPAPCDGILMQITAAGTRVNEGEVIAVVQPLDGSEPHQIRTDKSGRVVMARRFRAVRKDDALAVVVDIESR